MKKKKSTLLIVGMSFLLSIGTLMFSSCADKDDPSPILPTPEDTSYILKLKFSEKVEFKEILNKNDIQDLTKTELKIFMPIISSCSTAAEDGIPFSSISSL